MGCKSVCVETYLTVGDWFLNDFDSSRLSLSIPVCNDWLLLTLLGVTVTLVFTRFGWTPLAPGIFPMMMSCTGLSIHKTLVLPMKYGVSSSTIAVG